ncbi:MAG: transposase, partial [Eubacteriales bacterium]|nr:transposase [Eubacteriales bacterium]
MLRLDYPEYAEGKITIEEAALLTDEPNFPPALLSADKTLNDERFEEHIIKDFNVRIGRGSVPVRPFLRLMFLKRLNSWGYEALVRNVNENYMLKRFCRIPMDEPVPHSTSLLRTYRKYGSLKVNKILKAVDRKNMSGGPATKLHTDNNLIEYLKSAADKIRKVFGMIRDGKAG